MSHGKHIEHRQAAKLLGVSVKMRAKAIGDVGFGLFRSQLVIADRWYPSSRLCSTCGWKNEALTLRDREGTCQKWGKHHNRDHNAALNLKRLATGTALPVASPAGNGGAAAEKVSFAVGKVTPVRHDWGQQDTSSQEKNRARYCAYS